MSAPLYDVVVPTVGRPSLVTLVDALRAQVGAEAGRIVVVDDRRAPAGSLLSPGATRDRRVRVVTTFGAGPGRARNAGAAATNAPWVVFLDDDVEPAAGWARAAASDLRDAARVVGGVQGRLVVPLPAGRRATDWERNTAALASSHWITADMAYRRAVLVATGGFDERFRRAYREDADLALRVLDAGWRLEKGTRTVRHPVRPAPWWVSIAKQLGNDDDELMAALHGPGWRERAGAPRGRARRHAAVTTAGLAALAAHAAHRTRAAALLGACWAAGTGELAWARIAPGPRSVAEIARMAATSVAIPPVATAVRAAGRLRHRDARPRPRKAAIDAVILDRDGTIVEDVPYNGDPAQVRPAEGAQHACARLRDLGVAVMIASNQSGVARGLLTTRDVERVNARVGELLGPFTATLVCPHGPDDGCACRKPAAGLVLRAASIAQTRPDRCVVIGDCAADVGAAQAAGAVGILVPNAATRAEEIADAPLVADDLETAVDYVVAMGTR